MSAPPEIHIVEEGAAWAEHSAALLHRIIESTLASRGRLHLVLSGGSTPKALYSILAAPPWSTRVDWSRIRFCFGDERCVPPDHPDSNYYLAQTALFRPLNVPEANIFRLKGECADPSEAARDYEATLRRLTGVAPTDVPQLEVILLGLGEDGHTASLFPGTPAVEDRAHLVTVGAAPGGIRQRLTLTLGVINRASMILFLVTGAAKASIVRRVIEPQCESDRTLPAARVRPDNGRLLWILDRPAAGELTAHDRHS